MMRKPMLGFFGVLIIPFILIYFPPQFECPGLPPRENVTAESLLLDYKQLQNTASGACYAKIHQQLKSEVVSHQDQLFDLIFSGNLSDAATIELLYFGTNDRKYNANWAPFIARVRKHQSLLSKAVQDDLHWLWKSHGW